MALGFLLLKKALFMQNLLMTNGYELIDSGEGLKLERFGPHVLSRHARRLYGKKAFRKRPGTQPQQPLRAWMTSAGNLKARFRTHGQSPPKRSLSSFPAQTLAT